MGDSDFDDFLDDYLDDEANPNFDMLDVEIVWVRGNSAYGTDHIAINNVTEAEVEEVLLEIPPEVEAPQEISRPYLFLGSNAGGTLVVHRL